MAQWQVMRLIERAPVGSMIAFNLTTPLVTHNRTKSSGRNQVVKPTAETAETAEWNTEKRRNVLVMGLRVAQSRGFSALSLRSLR